MIIKTNTLTGRRLLIIVFSLLICSTVIAQNDNNAPSTWPRLRKLGEFYDDESRNIPSSRKKTLTNMPGNDSGELQKLIDELNDLGGGIITIPKSGIWVFSEIELKSNIHLFIEKGAVIRPIVTTNKNNHSLFKIGTMNKSRIQDVSIRGVGGRFIIDMRNLAKETRLTPFNVKGAKNFYVNNALVKDNVTIHAAMNVSLLRDQNQNWIAAQDGWVQNINITGAHGGYGAIQIRSGLHIHFRNIRATGGVALRIESDDVGANGSLNAPQNKARVSRISGYNITGVNGNAAVMLQPWGATNGWVDVEKINGISCMAAVRIDKAYVAINAINIGTFDPDSRITDVSSKYGTSAQVKNGVHPFVPCELRTNSNILRTIPIPNMDNGAFFKGPCISPIVYSASTTQNTTDQRYYTINIPTSTQLRNNATGFPAISKMITRDNDRRGNCNNNAREITETLSGEPQVVKLYPNPVSNGIINVELVEGSKDMAELIVFDFTGNQLSKHSFVGSRVFRSIDLGLKPNNLYMLQVNVNNQTVERRKIIVQ
ncbi:T9SS type A sorting domain-containing protein [Reichenbachiella versicolor]|uniref:T9SS type A sorting domain-containing protein n=1 Tax=Reichenbachiella versicolor TaxID=1821036 RepID=UPI000D6E8FCD|nr:T9SS type A sorting domain-containing protein [Reichenbachiella versicolor]